MNFEHAQQVESRQYADLDDGLSPQSLTWLAWFFGGVKAVSAILYLIGG